MSHNFIHSRANKIEDNEENEKIKNIIVDEKNNIIIDIKSTVELEKDII
jgi:hypothetical protein